MDSRREGGPAKARSSVVADLLYSTTVIINPPRQGLWPLAWLSSITKLLQRVIHAEGIFNARA